VVLTPQWLVSSFVEVYPPDRVAMRQHPEGLPDAGKTCLKAFEMVAVTPRLLRGCNTG
jgi:hypothetical protein